MKIPNTASKFKNFDIFDKSFEILDVSSAHNCRFGKGVKSVSTDYKFTTRHKFVLIIWMHFSQRFQILQWNFKNVDIFANFVTFWTCRLQAPSTDYKFTTRHVCTYLNAILTNIPNTAFKSKNFAIFRKRKKKIYNLDTPSRFGKALNLLQLITNSACGHAQNTYHTRVACAHT